jgi:hypothetical protein
MKVLQANQVFAKALPEPDFKKATK